MAKKSNWSINLNIWNYFSINDFMNQQTITFLTESNLIEGVGEEGLPDSIKAFTYLMQVRAPLTEKHILKLTAC